MIYFVTLHEKTQKWCQKKLSCPLYWFLLIRDRIFRWCPYWNFSKLILKDLKFGHELILSNQFFDFRILNVEASLRMFRMTLICTNYARSLGLGLQMISRFHSCESIKNVLKEKSVPMKNKKRRWAMEEKKGKNSCHKSSNRNMFHVPFRFLYL